MTYREIAAVVLMVLAAIGLGVTGLGRTPLLHVQLNAPSATAIPLETTTDAPQNCTSFYPTPTYCLFGLHDVGFTIHSAFYYEIGLLGGETPVDDIDYMIAAGTHQKVKLPGHKWDIFRYYGEVYVSGSGIVEEFGTPNGHRFAYLHIAQVYIKGPTATAPILPSVPPSAQRLSGDEATALRVLAAPAPTASGIITVRGGTVVGLTGWPSSTTYSNNSCYDYNSCRDDAHLCLSLTAGARDFFFRIIDGKDVNPHPKPKFDLKLWQRHTKKISAYSHKKLTRAAQAWSKAKPSLGPVLSRRYYPKTKHRAVAFYLFKFSHGTITTWPSRPAWHPKVKR